MDISCALQFYFFQLGERNQMIGKLKDFLRSLNYLKIKPSHGIIFDNSLLLALREFQHYNHLRVTDGYFNDETYLALGKEMSPAQLSEVSRFDSQRIIRWLLQGKPAGEIPFIAKSPFEKSNGNPDDERTDAELARLLTVNGIVRAASASRGDSKGDNHFRLSDGKIYTIHIYGDETGSTATSVYLPKYFSPPKYDGGDIVTATTKKGEVIGIAHIRVSSQFELNRNYNSGKVNSMGSKYIGETAGLNGDSVCYRHSHLHFFPNAAARLIIKNVKTVGWDPTVKDSKYLLDVRELLNRH